jgi:phosphoglycerate dehydrogenase-like enzyme
MSASQRPAIAVAMMAGLDDAAFGEHHWARLAAIGRVIEREPLRSLTDDRAKRVLADADVLLGHWGCPTLTDEALANAPRLALFAYAAGTVKWQVTDAVWQRGVVVTSAAAANAVPVAEYTVAMILLANKGALLFRERLRDPSVDVPLDPARVGNVAKRVGIVGASHVGRAVIALLAPYDLEIAVYDPYLSAEEAVALGVERVAELDDLCATVDVLSVHAPDIEATHNMIGARQFALLRDGTTFINTARPALVDQDALIAELESGRIAAVLDVTTPEPLPAESPLLALPNVFVTPHIAGSLGTELARMADLAIDEIERYARGEPPRYSVQADDIDRIA